ncbi:MAG: MFS transporter [Actinobacteria bacterium]|nr:MFS transporter [Actinomycetota bacterium]
MDLLRRRDLQLVLGAVALSSMGDYFAYIPLALRLHDSTGSGWAISGLLLVALIPLVAFAPLAGWLVDRYETVRVLAVASAAQAALAVGLAFAHDIWLIYALFFLLGIGVAVTQPAVFALVPRIVGEERVGEANGFVEMARWAGAAIGPAAGGTLAGFIGTRAVLLGDAVTFLAVVAAAVLLTVRRPPQPAEEGGPRERARDGFAFLGRDPLLLLVVAGITAIVVFAAIDNVAEVFFAKDVLGAGDAGYGALVTAWTVGMVVGTVGIGRRISPGRLVTGLIGSEAVTGAAVALTAAVALFVPGLIGFFVGGVGNGVVLVAMRTLIHHRVPDRLRGRVFAAYYGLVSGAQIVAYGGGGALLEWVGARGSLLVAGLASLVVAAATLIAYVRLPAEQRAVRPRVGAADGSVGPGPMAGEAVPGPEGSP